MGSVSAHGEIPAYFNRAPVAFVGVRQDGKDTLLPDEAACPENGYSFLVSPFHAFMRRDIIANGDSLSAAYRIDRHGSQLFPNLEAIQGKNQDREQD
jgi:hypothetical protein